MEIKYTPIGKITGEEKRFVETVKSIANLFRFETDEYRYGSGGSGYGALILEKTWGEPGRPVVIGVRYFLAAEEGPYFTIWDSTESKNGNRSENGRKLDGMKINVTEDFYYKNDFGEFSVKNLSNLFKKKLGKYLKKSAKK